MLIETIIFKGFHQTGPVQDGLQDKSSVEISILANFPALLSACGTFEDNSRNIFVRQAESKEIAQTTAYSYPSNKPKKLESKTSSKYHTHPKSLRNRKAHPANEKQSEKNFLQYAPLNGTKPGTDGTDEPYPY